MPAAVSMEPLPENPSVLVDGVDSTEHQAWLSHSRLCSIVPSTAPPAQEPDLRGARVVPQVNF
jgi:hypothetical protein